MAHLAGVDAAASVVPASSTRGDRRVTRSRVVVHLLLSRIAADRARHEAVRLQALVPRAGVVFAIDAGAAPLVPIVPRLL